MSIQDIRDQSQGIVTKFIVGLIIIVFAAFGMGSITTFLAPIAKVATVNGVDVTQQEMEVEVERSRRRLQGRGQINVDEDKLRQDVLQTLIYRQLLTQTVEDMGLQFSEARLDSNIVATSEFQIDGTYNPDRFQLVIGSAGYSPLTYRREMRRDKMFAQLSTGISQTAFLTKDEINRLGALAQQTRDVAFLRIDVEKLSEGVEVLEDEAKRYFDIHPDDFMTNETVEIGYLELKRSDFLEKVIVTEDKLRLFFANTREIYAEEERRRIAHILIEISDDVTEGQAKTRIDDIFSKISSGEEFGALAGEYSEDPGSAESGGDLGFNERGTFVEAFEEAAYQLDLNQMSQPVLTEFGYHLIKLLDVEAAKSPMFEEVMNKVEAAFREDVAEELFIEQSALLSDISFVSDLEIAAGELGLEVKTTGIVTRNESTGIASNAAVIEAVFGADVLIDGNNSDLIEITLDHHVVVRNDAYQPQQLKPLDEVSATVNKAVSRMKAAEIAEQQAQEMVQMLKAGSITRFVADKFGLTWTVVAKATRNQFGLDPEINVEAFSLPRPAEGNKSVGYAILNNGDAAVISVTNVTNSDNQEQLSGLARILATQQGTTDFRLFRDNLEVQGAIESTL